MVKGKRKTGRKKVKRSRKGAGTRLKMANWYGNPLKVGRYEAFRNEHLLTIQNYSAVSYNLHSTFSSILRYLKPI